MKILVTGASGFIGYNLLKELKDKHLDVVGMIRRTSKKDHLGELDIPLEICDITDAEALKNVFSKVKPKIVIHACGRVLKASPDIFYKVNAQGTENICGAAYEAGIARLVHISSVAAINGNPGVPLTDDMPLSARTPYGESKLEAEKIVNAWRGRGLRCAVVRPCMVYGAEEPHALENILRAVSRRILPSLSSPVMDRKLQLGYIDNIVEIIVLCMKRAEALKGTVIAADKDVLSYGEFLETVYKELSGSEPPRFPASLAKLLTWIRPVRKKIDRHFPERTYDLSRAIGDLAWSGGVPTREGLKRTLSHYREKFHQGEK